MLTQATTPTHRKQKTKRVLHYYTHAYSTKLCTVWSSTDGQKCTLLQKPCSIHTHSIGIPVVEFALYRYNYKIPLLNYYLLAQIMAQYSQVKDGKMAVPDINQRSTLQLT